MTPNRWPGRLAAVALFVPPGSHVIDLGAGSGGLRERLHPSCTYQGADLPDFDMNRGRWPDGSYDVAVMAGVLEYARYPGAVFRHLARLAPLSIVTYSHGGRRDRLWTNDISPDELRALAAKAGLAAEPVGTWRTPRVEPQTIWRLRR